MSKDSFSTTTSTAPVCVAGGSLQALLDWEVAVARSMLLVQRQQLEMMFAWQRSATAVLCEFRDQWVCRFGGGVPLDG
ncbi:MULTISPECIES: hypothetical protein [Variovorax]|uniref:Uncharacterized protein n=1 Tax=Variovorax guangxiensis TaxID=1775474 RepID=A0A840FJ65_9BURK|nr:hypothetical protein [Variovorax guangxiensis]MBB4221643.1 hypothetical protein [Variovorax guangxiensis]